jgi:hypothetical protein
MSSRQGPVGGRPERHGGPLSAAPLLGGTDATPLPRPDSGRLWAFASADSDSAAFFAGPVS